MDELIGVLSVAQEEVRDRATAFPPDAEERRALEMAAAALDLAGQIVARRPRKAALAWLTLETALAALRPNRGRRKPVPDGKEMSRYEETTEQ